MRKLISPVWGEMEKGGGEFGKPLHYRGLTAGCLALLPPLSPRCGGWDPRPTSGSRVREGSRLGYQAFAPMQCSLQCRAVLFPDWSECPANAPGVLPSTRMACSRHGDKDISDFITIACHITS